LITNVTFYLNGAQPPQTSIKDNLANQRGVLAVRVGGNDVGVRFDTDCVSCERLENRIQTLGYTINQLTMERGGAGASNNHE